MISGHNYSSSVVKYVIPHSHLQVGACIVNPSKKIVGIGYNGMPLGCSDDQLPWGKSSSNKLETKYMYGKYTASFEL